MTAENTVVPNPHRIDIELAAGGDVRPTVSCSAPEGALCRLHCGICEDYWNDDHDSHVMVDQGFCLVTEGWFDDPMYILEMYEGEPSPIHSGPIKITFDGDGLTWAYDNEATAQDEEMGKA